jgi:PRTRC genetic system protein E
MFKELMPIIENRALTITVVRVHDGKIKLCVVPHALEKDDEINKKVGYRKEVPKISEQALKALTTPLSMEGTPDELDAELVQQLSCYAEVHTRLQHGIAEATQKINAALNEIEEREKNKTKPRAATTAGKKEDWQGDLRILDHTFELSERQREEARAEMDAPARTLFLVADFSSAASIPIAATLEALEREDHRLPAAFFVAFRHCLRKWMLVYDYDAASEHAELAIADREDAELADSIYPKVKTSVPPCLQGQLGMHPSHALSVLRETQRSLTDTTARELVSRLLEMQRHSAGHPHYWPYRLIRQVPGLDDYLEECDGIGPGCLLNWYEDDPIAACFDEETSYIGQNGPLAPSLLRAISLNKSEKALDRQVQRVFDYVAAMIRSLATAAQVVEIIRELFDEHLRRHRVQRGLQTDPGAPDLRQEQL